MNDTQITKITTEIRREQHVSPFEEDETIKGYIKEAEYDINKNGFYEAYVDHDQCINCGKCQKVCSKFLKNQGKNKTIKGWYLK